MQFLHIYISIKLSFMYNNWVLGLSISGWCLNFFYEIHLKIIVWYKFRILFLITVFNLITYGFSHCFRSELPVKTIMGKGISCTHKYDQQNRSHPSPNTTFIISQCFDTYIKTQRNSVSAASSVGNDESSSGLYQSTNQHANTDGKDNDD